ncbi:MAG: DNA-binding protein [Candidatus Woesearchaeota archaeon]
MNVQEESKIKNKKIKMINPYFQNSGISEEELRLQQQINALEELVKKNMTKEAISRYSNIKIAHPEIALNLIILLGTFIKQGKIRGPINDEQLKEILKQITSKKTDFKITKK